jgi:hypothetical protein
MVNLGQILWVMFKLVLTALMLIVIGLILWDSSSKSITSMLNEFFFALILLCLLIGLHVKDMGRLDRWIPIFGLIVSLAMFATCLAVLAGGLTYIDNECSPGRGRRVCELLRLPYIVGGLQGWTFIWMVVSAFGVALSWRAWQARAARSA